jgi:hypothetical protein
MLMDGRERDPLAERYRLLAARAIEDQRVSEGTGFGASRGLRISGKIFAIFQPGGLVLKLPKARVNAIVEAGYGNRFDPGHGRLMKEWISVPPNHADQWEQLLLEARDFVAAG